MNSKMVWLLFEGFGSLKQVGDREAYLFINICLFWLTVVLVPSLALLTVLACTANRLLQHVYF